MWVTLVTITSYPLKNGLRRGGFGEWRANRRTGRKMPRGDHHYRHHRRGRPPHRPCGSQTRPRPGLRQVRMPLWRLAVPMWLRVAYSGTVAIIVRNMGGVVPFRGECNRGRVMSFSAELVPCCRTMTLPDGRTEKVYWLLIYTDPKTGRWCEEFFRRKIEAEAARRDLMDRWGGW